MRKWLDAGYFKHDLPIRLKHWQSFYPLGLLYPDPTLAFQSYSAIDPAYLLPPGHPLHLPKPQQQAVPPQHSLQHQMQQQELQRQRAMEQQREQLRQQEQAQQQAQQQREQQQREMIQREQQRINQQREQQLLEQQRQQQMLQEQSKRAAEEAQRHQQQHQQILNDQKSRVSNLLQEQQQRLQQQRSQASQQQQTLPMHGQPQPTKKQSKNAPQTLAQQAQQLAQQQQAQQQAMQQAMQQALQQQQQQQQAAPTAPWIGAKGAQGPSLAEIQQQEQMQMSAAQRQAQAEQARRGLKNGLPWGGESAGAGAGKNQQQAYQNNLAAIQQAEAAAANSAAAQQKAERDRQHKANQKADQKMILQRQAEIEKVRKGWSATGSDAAMGSHDSNNLSAIMAEEQRVLQSKRQAANSQGQSTGAHSWAAKIGTPTGGFYTESHAANAIDFPPVSATAPTPAPVAAPAAAPKQQQKQKAAAAAPAAPQAVAIPPNMSAEMAEFCISSLTKLGQNVDLTLPSFCLGSVESSTEVREYFSDYYGSTPAVSQFATEFIRRKEKGSGPGKGKKGKK